MMSDSIDRLFLAVCEAGEENPAVSRTARLRREGVNKMAKKVAEEAAEVAIEAVSGAREALIRESADLLYNLVVLWCATDVTPQDVYDEMDRRERMFGIAHKLPKSASGSFGGGLAGSAGMPAPAKPASARQSPAVAPQPTLRAIR